MFSPEVKAALKKWNNTKQEDRDYDQGLRILVLASGNKSFLRTIPYPEKRKDFIDYHLTKYIRFAISEEERLEVRKMEQTVKQIIKDNQSLSAEKDDAKHRGKREDHDQLPDDIKALYVENLDLLRKIRELHLKLRTLTIGSQCPDAERYPFLKEIISLDKKMHKNWKEYDSYIPDNKI